MLTRCAQFICDSPDTLCNDNKHLQRPQKKKTKPATQPLQLQYLMSEVCLISSCVSYSLATSMLHTDQLHSLTLKTKNTHVTDKVWSSRSNMLTGRNLSTKLTTKGDRTNNINWDLAVCTTYSTNYKQRFTLESWFTNLEPEPLIWSQLPALYKRLIQNLKQTTRQYTDSNNANGTNCNLKLTSYINRLTAAQAIKTTLTNSLSQHYSNLDDLLSLTCTNSPGFKPFTSITSKKREYSQSCVYTRWQDQKGNNPLVSIYTWTLPSVFHLWQYNVLCNHFHHARSHSLLLQSFYTKTH